MTTSLERKRRAQQRHRTARRSIVVALVVTPPALLAAAAYSPFLDVDAVHVRGTHRLSAAAIARAANVRDGAPLVSLDVGAVRRRVAALPGVKHVTVMRSWPSAVTVDVVERVPVVAVPRDEGRSDLYDIEAVRVDTVSRIAPSMAVLRVDAGSPSREVVVAAVQLLRALPGPLRSRVRDLHADGAASLSFRFADGSQVLWGSAERTAEKVRVLTLLVKHPAERYDVRVPDHPAVVPR